jgi:hypothetical protein
VSETTWRRCDAGHTYMDDAKSRGAHTALHDPNAGFRHEPSNAPIGWEEPTPGKDRKPSGAKVLLGMAGDAGLVLIRDQHGKPWAKMPGRVISPITQGGIGGHLLRLYLAENNEPPPRGAIAEAIEHLKGLASTVTDHEPVHLRFGPLPDDGGIAIDLGTDDHTAIVITPAGWSIEPHPVNFRRPGALRPLPVPTTPADFNLEPALSGLLNVADEDAVRLVIAYLIGLLKPSGPCLGMAFTGPAGSAKTFGARVIRRILDPVDLDGGGGVKSLPGNEADFAVMAISNAVVCIDNLSGLRPEQADWIAQLMTGYSDEGRVLYTDDETRQRAAKRPVILTGIDITDRGDLLSRLLMVELAALHAVTTEDLLWERFDAVHPAILGALCSVVAQALRRLPDVPREGWTVRMADVARFVTAAEPALGWTDRWFEQALAESQGQAVVAVLGEQSWYGPLVAVLEAHGGSVTMEPTALLDEMRERYAKDQAQKRGAVYPDTSDYPRGTDTTWPKNGRAMTSILKRHTAGLERAGVTWAKRLSNSARLYDLALAPDSDQGGG